MPKFEQLAEFFAELQSRNGQADLQALIKSDCPLAWKEGCEKVEPELSCANCQTLGRILERIAKLKGILPIGAENLRQGVRAELFQNLDPKDLLELFQESPEGVQEDLVEWYRRSRQPIPI